MQPAGRSCASQPSCAELDRLLKRRNSTPAHQRRIDRQIIRKFRRTRAVFVLDMAGFSISVQRYGIIHHLAKIHRMQAIVGAAVRTCGGVVAKFEADNCFATFSTAARAVEAGRRIQAELKAANISASERDALHVSIGIGYGPILLACDDLFGDEMNLASKLGEDIAQSGEVLLTERARRSLRGARLRFEEMALSISGVHLRAAKLVLD
jgi:class 3 adenylate cyclase